MTKKSMSLEVDPSIMEKNMRIVEDNPLDDEINKLLSSVDPYPSKLVKPTPGFCVKTYTKTEKKKVFINICLTDAIPCPRDITNEELMQILNSEDPSSYRVPMSLGEGRSEKDKSGSPATVYDVAVNSQFYKKIDKNDLFQSFFLTVVCEGLQDKYQFELDMQNYIILKNRKSIGTLQTHRIQIRDVKQYEDATKQPLIEELGDGDKPTAQLVELPKSCGKDIAYRLRREPPTGEIDHLLAEFQIPDTVELKDVHLEVGEDRLVLDFKGAYNVIDFFLPCSVDQDVIDAQLDRNKNILSSLGVITVTDNRDIAEKNEKCKEAGMTWTFRWKCQVLEYHLSRGWEQSDSMGKLATDFQAEAYTQESADGLTCKGKSIYILSDVRLLSKQ